MRHNSHPGRLTKTWGNFPLFLPSLLILAALGLILQGCTLQAPQKSAPQTTQRPVFLAPTAVPPATITPQPVQIEQRPTPTIPCVDGLVFVSDLTIPDGSSIQPGSSVDKRWEVENSGTCNWSEGYTLRLVAGDELGAQPDQPLIPARSSTKAVIRILFQAPPESGQYRSAWQAHNPTGDPFGDPIYMDIEVP